MPPRRATSTTLTGVLDTKIMAKIHELEEYETSKNSNDSLTVSRIYQYLQESDHAFRRMKKSILEKSIGRILTSFQGEFNEEEPISLDSDFEGLEEQDLVQVKNKNAMNKGITSLWKSQIPFNASAESINPDDKKRDGLQDESTMPPSKRKERPDGKESGSSKKHKVENKWASPSNISLEDLGGVEDCVEEILELIAMPLSHPEVYAYTGIQPPRGILLHGPPGCGKTMMANAIAGELKIPFMSLSAPSVVSGMSGESEKKVRDIFEEAKQLAPCIVFLDEIDAITPKRENAQREMERRIVAQLLTFHIQDLSFEKTNGKPVLIIGATNRPDSLDPALRRAGRFDREICMNVPSEKGRESILKVISKGLRLSGDLDFKSLARMTPGYVGADLKALTGAAGVAAIKRIFKDLALVLPNLDCIDLDNEDDSAMIIEANDTMPPNQFSAVQKFLQIHKTALTPEQLAPLSITPEDFLTALPKIQPSSKREGFTTVPDVTWADVGALQSIRIELQMAIVQPIKRPELYASVGITAPAGVLLWGPPGCGKTLLAKAVANESKANFISVRGPELLNKYVGESERAVRQVFLRARASAPCVIFFDELDALVPRRDDSLSESSSRVVNTLLTELDGLGDRNGVYVIAATNRPDIIDPAMMRPGRLDKPLFVDLPSKEERFEILKTLTKKTPLSPDVHLAEIAIDTRCENFSGADLAALVREAAVAALRIAVFEDIAQGEPLLNESSSKSIKVTSGDFHKAFSNVQPSVSTKDRQKYTILSKRYGIPTADPTKQY
ncbi:putative AAA domain-containing protein [Neolecta irregularis DAH-3]|uniref:Peroxisomal ATPase PEX1 n=1 Tax=Neolecta irregularis (strain DAH-3) TaxID=1198029 RepID=A0A1U7LJT7_NEOID|nr:putative AAA domain-containing protein [Neolecta irregularis DAH-3]|eukprot:OLL22920.1 putative AAA domain-containing protein [Neolecta irregularis DAH-3]